LDAFSADIVAAHGRTGEPVTLVGWSLGGYIARETARDHPEAVAKVVTLGTPVYGGPRYSAVADYYQRQGFDLDEIEHITIERYSEPIRVPVLAIYSRNDGIVNWKACIDHWSPRVEHVEVTASHLGMGFARASLKTLARHI
jgi:dienelactone hydrolase